MHQENFIYYHAQPFSLESGETLPEIRLAYATSGSLNAEKNNVVWICHALTGNAEPSDWWSGLVGEGKFFNPAQHFIVCVNMLGSCYGSTNATDINPTTRKPYFHTFPLLTIRDVVNGLDLVREYLGIEKIQIILGGSMGAMQALEWSIMKPDIIGSQVLMASNARSSAWAIAFNEAQRMAIEADITWKSNSPDAGKTGMKAARAMALLSYRNYHTFQLTQTDDDLQKTDNFMASTYERHQGEKIYNRFHAFAYHTITKIMDSHNIARRRGSLEHVLQQITTKTLVVGISSDVLFPVEEQKFMAAHIPGAEFREIDSVYGHDGFLVENEQIITCLERFLQANPIFSPKNIELA
ncbi:MAG: homoserine O-acetyltransferase [Verrucomicrobia bacterium]|nr:homoserine O-acetyltransferase [Cytophagales bacterium]